MAPRTSSKRSSPTPRPPASRSYAQQAESAEVRRSRKAAILQLKIGRLAHIIGIASGLALALTGIIAYGLENWSFLENAPVFMPTLKWLIPLIAGAAVALAGLWIKWEPYVADRNEPHFVMSIVALVAPLFIILLIIFDEYDYVQLGRPEWLYPASLLGICLTEISLAMTWERNSSRKTISIAASVFPLLLMFFPMVYNFTPNELASILPMAYLGSAVAIQLSGSMLHIISSSTSVQQREVLKASDSKLKEDMKEVERKRHALMYREDALRAKESELEAYEKRLLDEMDSIEEKKAQAAVYESEIEKRMQAVHDERQKFAKQQAEVDDLRETLRMKQGDLDAQRSEIEKYSKSLLTKESALAARERDANKLLLESESKGREIRNRLAEVEAQEASLADLGKELEQLQSDLADREKQLTMKESAMDLKALEATLAKEQLGAAASAERASYKNIEQELLSKQEKLAQREIALKAAEDELRHKSEKAERLISRSDKQMNDLVEKESAILAREQALAEREEHLKLESEKLDGRVLEIERAMSQITDKERQYGELTETARTRISSVTVKEEEISRKMAALEKREEKIKELEGRLVAEREKMNSKLVELLEKEKDLRAEEQEVSLKQAELKAMEREILESVEDVEEARAEFEEVDEEEQARVLDFREKQLAQKEQEMKARLYQREKELEKRELSLRSRLAKDIEEVEEAVEEEYSGERIKTGIERLDDLLVGGMPFGSNVLCVGPPFIGKEVAMQLFLAEGLKKGVPAIVITTSKPPAELSKEMAPILPTFKELEQLGLVYWIDATGLGALQGADENGENIRRVSGPGDLEGIMEAVDACIGSLRGHKAPYFRALYFSLSMSITQAEEKLAYQFVQTIVGKMKQAGAVALYAVERGMHTEQQLESIQHHMTGAIQFKTEKQKTLLSVQGIGDVQTRDWIEYRHTNKAVMIGAFSLERIR